MTPEALLRRLAALNVTLTAHGDRLRVEAPEGALTAELRAALAEHKLALLGLLNGRRDPGPQRMRIPLSLDESPSEWLAKRGLHIVGGDLATGTLFVAELLVGGLQVACPQAGEVEAAAR
jgi:hypothetical protein